MHAEWIAARRRLRSPERARARRSTARAARSSAARDRAAASDARRRLAPATSASGSPCGNPGARRRPPPTGRSPPAARRPRAYSSRRRRASSRTPAPRGWPPRLLRSGSPRLRCCALDRVPALPLANEPCGPGRHRIARRHPSAHPRQLEMGVRVDEARQDGGSADSRHRSAYRRLRVASEMSSLDPPTATMRPRSTSTHPSRIGGASIGRTHAARWTRDISVTRQAGFLLGRAARGIVDDLGRAAGVAVGARDRELEHARHGRARGRSGRRGSRSACCGAWRRTRRSRCCGRSRPRPCSRSAPAARTTFSSIMTLPMSLAP